MISWLGNNFLNLTEFTTVVELFVFSYDSQHVIDYAKHYPWFVNTVFSHIDVIQLLTIETLKISLIKHAQ